MHITLLELQVLGFVLLEFKNKQVHTGMFERAYVGIDTKTNFGLHLQSSRNRVVLAMENSENTVAAASVK